VEWYDLGMDVWLNIAASVLEWDADEGVAWMCAMSQTCVWMRDLMNDNVTQYAIWKPLYAALSSLIPSPYHLHHALKPGAPAMFEGDTPKAAALRVMPLHSHTRCAIISKTHVIRTSGLLPRELLGNVNFHTTCTENIISNRCVTYFPECVIRRLEQGFASAISRRAAIRKQRFKRKMRILRDRKAWLKKTGVDDVPYIKVWKKRFEKNGENKRYLLACKQRWERLREELIFHKITMIPDCKRCEYYVNGTSIVGAQDVAAYVQEMRFLRCYTTFQKIMVSNINAVKHELDAAVSEETREAVIELAREHSRQATYDHIIASNQAHEFMAWAPDVVIQKIRWFQHHPVHSILN